VSPSAALPHEPNPTSTLLVRPGVLVVKRHHILVRCSHWLNIPPLFGLILSGISIYWSSPVYQHKPDPVTGNFDVAADIGIWICARVPGQHHYPNPPDWIYNHMSLGPRHVGPGAAFALVVRILIHAERHRLRCGATHRRGLALLITSPDGSG